MYAPKHFREDRRETLLDAIAAIRFATLVLSTPEGLQAVHLPMLATDTDGTLTLEGHVARANPVWRAAAPDTQALAIFQGPHAYVHPAWLATKKTTGKVVPTWNYVAIHAHGPLSTIEDPAWLHHHVEALTNANESRYADAWRVSDAPVDYIEALVKGIVGVYIEVSRLEGVWKMIQHHPTANRQGVIAGLSESAAPNDQAAAATMRNLESLRAIK